ncbi:MAG TPA: VWA domain-containing protein, partial [Solirubrobacteraceae bacterium]|nr:VWA domain-containing protein [Solirubrobacteraceae bacterium]
MSDVVVDRVSSLAALMRSQGTRVGVGELLSAHAALAAVNPAARDDARLALRAVLCSNRADLERFELAFTAVFGDGRPRGDDSPLADLGAIEMAALPHAAIPSDELAEIRPDEPPTLSPAAYSAVELLRHKDFAAYTDDEMALSRELIGRLARRGPSRLSRRRRPSRRRSHEPDLRRMVRASLRTAGEPVERRWRAPTRRPRPVVLVCDVSGSMSPYARMLLQYLHACVTARRRVEA